jgi:hypothetical protein
MIVARAALAGKFGNALVLAGLVRGSLLLSGLASFEGKLMFGKAKNRDDD